MSIFSERLKNSRNLKHWSRKQAAMNLEIPYSTYSNYENGTREPDIKTISSMADLFDTTTDYLLGKTENPISDKNSRKDSFDIEDDIPLAYHGQSIPDEYLKIVKKLMEADSREDGN